MREAWTRAAGRSLRVLTTGAGPAVVLVPGLGALGYLRPLVRVLSRSAEVSLLDLPGFGDRRTADLPSDLDALAAVLAEHLAALPPALLVGHSTGAQVALRAALRVPVAGLVLAGATFPPEQRSLPSALRGAARVLVRESPAELPAVLPYYWRGRRRLPELLRSCLADRPEDVVDAVPPLVLRGRRDPVCPQPWAERLARSGRLEVLPGAHNTCWTHPEETAAAVLSGLQPKRTSASA